MFTFFLQQHEGGKNVLWQVCVCGEQLNRGAYGSVGGARGSVGGARKRGLVTLVPVQIIRRVFLLFAVLPPLLKCAASQRQLKNKQKAKPKSNNTEGRDVDATRTLSRGPLKLRSSLRGTGASTLRVVAQSP